MNYIVFIILGVAFLALFVIGKVFLMPYVKAYYVKRSQKQHLMNEQQDLLSLEKEVKFHMSWAKDRGESTDPYNEELKEIHYKLDNLQSKYQEVELKPISSLP